MFSETSQQTGGLGGAQWAYGWEGERVKNGSWNRGRDGK